MPITIEAMLKYIGFIARRKKDIEIYYINFAICAPITRIIPYSGSY